MLARGGYWRLYSFFSGGDSSFFSAGAAGAAGVTAAGISVAVGVVGMVCATGASCQWPCSTDHTLPGGGSPGGCGAGVNWRGGDTDGRDGAAKFCVGEAGEPDCFGAAGGLAKK